MTFRYRHGDRPLEGYTIQRGVGRGGFGEVYYALSDAGREVALKAIFQNHEIELRGIRHCINLKSPHLVSIFDVRAGEEGVPFVIMEYVAGPSLRDLLHEHPQGLGPQKAGYLAREIANGLSYLHERGIVHRDLKPENIFYEDGYVKIGDYGLSKYISVSRQSGQTISVGTIHYMAPEIGSGVYNREIDIYALGIILYELLTGRVPFTGDSFGEILMKHLTSEPDVSPLEEPFRSVVKKALEKKPEDRYSTAAVLAQDLFRDEALDRSVSLFNPASLSAVARRARPGRQEEPAALFSPGRAPLAGRPEPLPGSPGGTRDAAGTPPAPGAPLAAPSTGAPRDARTVRGEAPDPATSRPLERELGAGIAFRGAAALDPRSSQERLAAAGVVAAVATAVTCVLFGRSFASIFGFLMVVGSSAGAILVTELELAPRFNLKSGLLRQLVATFLAAGPAAAGAVMFRNGPPVALAFLLGLLIADWEARLEPRREARYSIGQAIWAGLMGILLGLFLAGGSGLLVGAAHATLSLALNACAPFVPLGARSRRPGGSGASGPGTSPGTTPGEPAGASVAFSPPPAWEPGAERAGAPPAEGAPSRDRENGKPVHRHLPAAPPGSPPGPLARVFWLLVAAACLASGLSCLIAPAFLRFHGDDAAGVVCCGLGLLGYVGFAFYRGLWARHVSTWRRTVRPFLLVTALNAMAISAVTFFAVDWRWPQDRAGVAAVFTAAFVSFCFLLASERLLGLVPQYRPESLLPRSDRPVHPLARIAQLLLATAGVGGCLVLALLGLFGPESGLAEGDRIVAFACAIAAGSLGAFFLRQSLRHRRGTLFRGTVRPFFITLSVASVAICGLLLAYPLEGPSRLLRSRDEVFRVVVVLIAAAVFGLFFYFLGAPGVSAPARGVEASPGRAGVRREVHAGWAALGLLFWLVASAAVLLAGLLSVRGLVPALGLDRLVARGDPDLYWGLHAGGIYVEGCALVAGGTAALGSLCLLLSRLRAGFFHVLRALAGQVFLAMAGVAFVEASRRLSVTPYLDVAVAQHGLPVLAFLVAGGAVLGLGLLAWPPPRGRAVRAPELAGLAKG